MLVTYGLVRPSLTVLTVAVVLNGRETWEAKERKESHTSFHDTPFLLGTAATSLSIRRQ
jgi:hypothetical protein